MSQIQPVEPTRRILREEVLIVLSLSLFQAAVYAIIDLLSAPIRGQVRLVYPQVDLAQQLAAIAFGLAPVWLVVHLVRRSGEGIGGIGMATDRFGRDVVFGIVIAAGVGVVGIALYAATVAMGFNRVVIPVPPQGHWWTIPILLFGAAEAALLEEVVVVGYLITRLRELRWGPVSAIAASALLRGSYHLYQGWGGFIGNVAMGVLFGWIFVRTKRLWPLIVAHFLLDVGAGLGFLIWGRALG